MFSLLGTIKLLIPDAFKALQEAFQFGAAERARERERRRELEAERFAAERQEDVALWSQMVHLQTRVIAQNESLIEFVTTRMESHVGQLDSRLTEIHHDLQDIEKRWLAMCREIDKGNAERQLMRMELTRIADQYQRVERYLERVVSSEIH